MGAVNEFFMQQNGGASARPKLTLNWRGKTAPVPDVIFDDYVDPKALVAQIEAAVKPAEPRALQVAPWIEPGPLDICLGHWTSWMQQDDRDLGAKSQAGIHGGAEEGEQHDGFDVAAAAADAAANRVSREIAMATDAMINSLPRDFKAAIWRRCNMTSVWSFPNMDFTAILPQAEEALSEKLSKNVATRAFW
jgi:hypothetical protein